MKPFVVLILGFILTHAACGQSGLTFKGQALKNAGYSIYALDAESGEVLYETPQISLVPASVMKLMTTAAALEILGPGFQFHTKIGYSGVINLEKGLLEGDLVLKGGADPAFYSEYFPEHYKGTFNAWAEAISKRGIKDIPGNLVVDLSRLEGPTIPGGWLWEDIGNYYGAGVSALTYSDNNYKIHFASPDELGKTVRISSIYPNIDSLRLVNKVISSEVNRDLSVVYGAPGSFSQLIEGTIPKGNTDFVVKAAMPDPALIAAEHFVDMLKKNGITISGKIVYVRNSKNREFNLIADELSPPLKDLIVPLNHESINLFAEHLLREIGRARKGSTELQESVDALKEFWAEKKIFMGGFYPTDGSGLSRSNALCTRTLAEVLRFMYLGPNREVFFNSLPVAGQSGTLRSAFKGSLLENNLQAKTGSMTRVRSLAGIFTNHSGKKVIFVVITNNFEGSQAAAGQKIESFLGDLYSFSTQTIQNTKVVPH